MEKIIDIRYNRDYPRNILSNLYPREFIFDGVHCSSLEGAIQSLRIPPSKVFICCAKSGFDAMQYGRDHRTPGPIHWNGKEMDRFDFSTYHEWLFDLYYAAYSQDEFSQRFLLATEDTKLTHKVGKSSPTETILTEREFIDTLVKVRNALKMDKLETDGVISWK